MTSPFGTLRRISTYHTGSGSSPGVGVQTDKITPCEVVLDSNAPETTTLFIKSIYGTDSAPAVSSFGPPDKDPSDVCGGKLVMPGGSNLNLTDMPPHAYAVMHRTNSVDYNIVVKGSMTLITPGADGKEEQETIVNVGDVVVQRGTLHAWRAGPEGVRFVSVLLDAAPVQSTDQDGKPLPLEEVLPI